MPKARVQKAPGYLSSRPLLTGDPEDAQLQLDGVAYMALAYWDADETADG